MTDRRKDPRAREYFDVACSGIRERMTPVCADMPRADFDRLVQDMARIRLRHEPWIATPPRSDYRRGRPSAGDHLDR